MGNELTGIAAGHFNGDGNPDIAVTNRDGNSYVRSLLDAGGGALVISQFTLYGDTRKGRRPGFEEAAPPEIAEPLYKFFVQELRRFPIQVAEGVFGAMMLIEIHNDGPVTFMLESPPVKNVKR